MQPTVTSNQMGGNTELAKLFGMQPPQGMSAPQGGATLPMITQPVRPNIPMPTTPPQQLPTTPAANPFLPGGMLNGRRIISEDQRKMLERKGNMSRHW